MKRARASKELRANAPRKMVRDNLPDTLLLFGETQMVFDLKSKIFRINMFEDTHRRLKEALEYSIEQFGFSSQAAVDKKLLSHIHPNTRATKGMVGCLGEMLYKANECIDTPNHSLVSRFFNEFCKATIQVTTSIQAGTYFMGLNNIELQELFTDIDDSITRLDDRVSQVLGLTIPVMSDEEVEIFRKGAGLIEAT